jgi:hypothetical protein
MGSFATNVYSVMQGLQTRLRFKPAVAYSSKSFAPLAMRLSDLAFAYVFVKDHRHGGGDMTVSVWIAPLAAPDDALDKLNIGFKIRIASEFEVDDAFFLAAESRIERLVPCLYGFDGIISDELRSPSFRSRKFEVYTKAVSVYSRMNRMASEGVQEVVAAYSTCRELIRKRASVQTFESACESAAAMILRCGVLSPSDSEFFQNDPKVLGYDISGFVYTSVLTE